MLKFQHADKRLHVFVTVKVSRHKLWEILCRLKEPRHQLFARSAFGHFLEVPHMTVIGHYLFMVFIPLNLHTIYIQLHLIETINKYQN